MQNSSWVNVGLQVSSVLCRPSTPSDWIHAWSCDTADCSLVNSLCPGEQEKTQTVLTWWLQACPRPLWRLHSATLWNTIRHEHSVFYFGKLTRYIIFCVSHNFLPRTICSVLNRCSGVRQKQKLRVPNRDSLPRNQRKCVRLPRKPETINYKNHFCQLAN